MNLTLHIVSFDIPYPPNYGGVIDVFYKLQALHEAGVKVILHCFEYQRDPAPELEELCQEVHYYPRRSGWRHILSPKPYIVSTRKSDALRKRLLEDDFPILFEGLHTCGLLSDPGLKKRIKIYRESNIEHHYYYHLFKVAGNFRERIFFLAESAKLCWFQPVLSHADVMLAVSLDDQTYLQRKFPEKDIRYLPSFHRENRVNSLPGTGSYVLYHGNLSVAENFRAARTIIEEIYTEGLPELVIAGLDPPAGLVRLIDRHTNIRLERNPADARMVELIREAQINLMVTSQPTGLKLKLLNALFHGRHCLVNPLMLAGTGLEPVCQVALTPEEFREKISQLFHREFTRAEVDRRQEFLLEHYSNEKNCKILTDLVFLFYEKDPYPR